MELRIKLQPKQRLFLESIERTPITFYGGAKGGGKSHAIRAIMLIRRFKFPNSIGAIFRQTYGDLEDNHIQPLFALYPELRQYYHEQKKELTLPNGSCLKFRYCQSYKDVGRYQGREYHDLAVDEAGEWEERTFRTLHGSNRSSLIGFKPRTFITGNPGGVGHGWLKRLFIDRRYREEEDPNDYHFIQAFVRDNPALIENDPDYIKRLKGNPNAALRKAYLEGDWDLHAGQFFQEISKEVHFIKPFEIPKHWNRFGAYDYGYNHPAAFGWFANDEDGNTYLYRELVLASQRVDQFAKQVNAFSDTSALYPIVAGHDCWTQKNTLREDRQPPTVAEEFLTHGISLQRAVIDRIQGAAHLRSYLAHQGRLSGKPRFFIFNTCSVSFDTLSRMIHDPDRVEDVLKVDATEGDPTTGDDAYDMIRYGLMSRPAITDKIIPKIAIGSPAWYQKQSEDVAEQIRGHFEKEQETHEGQWPSVDLKW